MKYSHSQFCPKWENTLLSFIALLVLLVLLPFTCIFTRKLSTGGGVLQKISS